VPRGRVCRAAQLALPAAWLKQHRFLYPTQRPAHDPLAGQAFMPIFSEQQWYSHELQPTVGSSPKVNPRLRAEERTHPNKMRANKWKLMRNPALRDKLCC